MDKAMSDTITFDNPSYPLWKAGYDAGAAAERAVSDRLLAALKEAYFDGWRDKVTYNDFEQSSVEEEFAKSNAATVITEVEAMRKEQE